MTGRHRGCLVCGEALAYRLEAAAVTCALCGAAGLSPVACSAGHFVCDGCHARQEDNCADDGLWQHW